MTEIDNESKPETAVPEQPATVGATLAAARVKAGMSVEDAAAQLRLGVKQIQAIEADDAAALPTPTFVRGFIRNYARLLALDVDTMLAMYRRQLPTADQGSIVLQVENIPMSHANLKPWKPYAWAAGCIVLALGLWVYSMEYAVRRGPTVVVKPAVTAPKAVVAPAVAETPPVAAQPVILPPAATAPVADNPAVPSAAPATTPPSPAAPVAALPGQARLVFKLTEPSWIGVTDRDGKSLLNKRPAAGAQEVVEGMPPLNIILGNAGGVQLTFNDKPVDLAPHTKSNVARLTLE